MCASLRINRIIYAPRQTRFAACYTMANLISRTLSSSYRKNPPENARMLSRTVLFAGNKIGAAIFRSHENVLHRVETRCNGAGKNAVHRYARHRSPSVSLRLSKRVN